MELKAIWVVSPPPPLWAEARQHALHNKEGVAKTRDSTSSPCTWSSDMTTTTNDDDVDDDSAALLFIYGAGWRWRRLCKPSLSSRSGVPALFDWPGQTLWWNSRSACSMCWHGLPPQLQPACQSGGCKHAQRLERGEPRSSYRWARSCEETAHPWWLERFHRCLSEPPPSPWGERCTVGRAELLASCTCGHLPIGTQTWVHQTSWDNFPLYSSQR